MEKALLYGIAGFVTLLSAYGIVAFITFESYITNWGQADRLLMVGLFFAGMVFLFFDAKE